MSHLQELILSSSSSLTCLHDLRTGSLLTSFKASSSGAGSQHGEISTLDGANGNGKGKGRANAGANANGADRSTSVYRRTVDVLEGADGQGGLVVAAVPGRGAINVWGFQKEAPIHRLLIPVKVSCLAISKNGLYLAVGAHDGRLLLWELSSGNLVASFDAHYRAVTCLAWTDDSAALVSGGDDAACHVWSLPVMLASPDNPLLPVAPYASLADHVLPLSSLSVSFGAFPSVRVLTASLDGTAKLWDLTLAAAGRALSAAAAAAADSANESGGQSRVKADHGAGSCLVSTFGFPPGAAVTHCALDQLERSFFAVYEDRRAQSTSSSSDGTSGSSSTSSSSGGGRCRLVKVDLYRRVRRGEAENDAGDGRDDGSDQQGEDDDDDEWEVVGGGGRGDIVRLREDGHVLSASAPAPSQTASAAPPATGTQSQRDADPRTARRSYSTASAAESIASLHLCALSSHLLVGLTSGRIDVLALPSLQCVRTLVPAVSSAAGSSLAHPITFLAALLRPTDLVSRTGGTRTTGTGAGAGAGAGGADEGVQPRYVAPQLGRNVVSASAHLSNQQGGVGDAGAGGVVNVRLTGSGAPALSMEPPSWSSLRETRMSSLSRAAPARSSPVSRAADGQPASVSVSASSAALQEENARLREQLARSIKLNERMWEEMVDGALAEGKRASRGTSMQADRQ